MSETAADCDRGSLPQPARRRSRCCLCRFLRRNAARALCFLQVSSSEHPLEVCYTPLPDHRPSEAVNDIESAPWKGESTQPVQVRPKEVPVRLGSYPGDGEGDQTIEASGDRGPPRAGQRV